MPHFFVTGTDTGVGKTTVAAGILAALRRRGVSVAAMKPAESGCSLASDGTLIPEDATLLCAAAGHEVVAPHRYATPVAPAVAARIEARPFDITSVVNAYDHMAGRSPRLLLVEGAGGLLAPFSDELLGADLAVALRLPLLVVARASLGTINHTLLTVLEARRRGLLVAAVILNRVAPGVGPDEATNASEIERLAHVRVLGPVPHVAPPLRRDLDALAGAVETAFDPGIFLAEPSTTAT